MSKIIRCPVCEIDFNSDGGFKGRCSKECYNVFPIESFNNRCVIGLSKLNKICPICNKEFTTNYPNQKYCHNPCKRVISIEKLSLKICLTCKKEFKQKWKNQKYCDLTCAGKKEFSEECRRNMGNKHKGLIPSKETRLKISKANKGRKMKPMTQERKLKIGLGNKGKIRSEETKNNQSKRMIEMYLNGFNPKNQYKKGFYTSKSNGILPYKSSYELAVMKYFDINNIDFIYETEFNKFKLSNNRYYLNDFYLVKNKKFVQVKGFEMPDFKIKWKLFCNEYPELKKELWKKDKLVELGILDSRGKLVVKEIITPSI
jgi:hypothetical protein